jgi:hypothetical protein
MATLSGPRVRFAAPYRGSAELMVYALRRRTGSVWFTAGDAWRSASDARERDAQQLELTGSVCSEVASRRPRS